MSGSDYRDRAAVCSLPPAEREVRVDWIRREILPRARGMERLVDGRAWAFDAHPRLQQALEELAGFERGCCGGLAWHVDVEPGTLRLRVQGLDPDSPFFDLLDAGPGAGPAGEGGAGRGALRLGGGGLLVGIAAFVACKLPFVLAFVGLGIASWLDAFGVVAVAAGVGLMGFGLWRRRVARPDGPHTAPQVPPRRGPPTYASSASTPPWRS